MMKSWRRLETFLTVGIQWREIKTVDHDSVRTWVIAAPLLAFVIPNNAFQNASVHKAFLNECSTRIAVHKKVSGTV